MSQFHSEILVELNLRNSKNYIMKFGSISIISQSKPANETTWATSFTTIVLGRWVVLAEPLHIW